MRASPNSSQGVLVVVIGGLDEERRSRNQNVCPPHIGAHTTPVSLPVWAKPLSHNLGKYYTSYSSQKRLARRGRLQYHSRGHEALMTLLVLGVRRFPQTQTFVIDAHTTTNMQVP